MGTKALTFENLDVNANYEVTISLDDGGDDDNKQVRKFTLKTPKFISRLSQYISESSISKNLRGDTVATSAIEYPGYTEYTEHTFRIVDISVDLGRITKSGHDYEEYNPNAPQPEHKCKITVTFDRGGLDIKQFTTVNNVATPLSDIFMDLTSGVTFSSNNKIMTITRNWGDLDPSITSTADWIYKGATTVSVYKRHGKYGFWNSDIFKALHSLSKASDVKKDPYWGTVKNGYIQYTTEKTVPAHTKKGTSTTTYTLDTILNTNLPSGIVANTIDEYDNGVVDYFYFFVNQGGAKNDGKWWYFDNDLTTIKPSANGGRISGSKGYIMFKDGLIDTGKDKDGKYKSSNGGQPKDINTSKKLNSAKTELYVGRLENRTLSANCNLFSGSNTPKSGKYTDATFPKMPVNIRFAVVRYVKGSDNIWRGKWMPNLASSPTKQETRDIMSSIEIIGAT
jgi:hypothetical protein